MILKTPKLSLKFFIDSIGNKVSGAMIGLGLNVTTNPVIEKDRFTPKAACLRDFTDSPQCQFLAIR